MKRAAGLAVLFLLLVLPSGPSAAATTYTWSGLGFDHEFGNPENWSPEGVPGDGDSIVVARLPGGPAHVENVPSITLESVTIAEGGRIYGAGLLTTTSFNWTGGLLGIDLTVTGSMSVSGADFKEANKTLLHEGRVAITARGTSTFSGTGEVRLSWATLRNEGVMDLGAVVLGGGGCCTNPNSLVNAGWISASGASLQLLRFDQTATGRITSGSMVLDRGDHIFRGGTIGPSATVALESSLLSFPGGTVQLNGTLVVRGSADLRGQATLRGPGLLRWQQGTIYASLTVAARFEASGSGGKFLNGTPGRGGGNLVLQGASDINMPAGSSLGLSSVGTPLTLRNEGTMTMRSGSIVGTSCCSSPSTFRNVGTVVVDAGAGGTAGLQLLAVRSSGQVSVRTGTLAFAGVAPVVTAGAFALAGGAVSVPTSAPLTFDGGRLTGAGTVQGPVRNNAGVIAPGGAAIGTIRIGGFQQGSAGRLETQVRTLTSADRLVTTAPATLAGTLAISKLGTAAVSPGTITVLTTTSRTGTFSPVTGLASLGSGWRVSSTATAVRLVKP